MAALPDLAPLIVQALRRQPDLSSAELQTQLGASQATVSRALAKLTAAGQVRKVGAARSQRYLLPRTVPGVGSAVQIMQVDATGQVSLFAQLVPMAGGGYWVDEVGGPGARHDGLPWFLEDMRPQGFMGPAFAQAHPELQLGSDPRHWSDEDVPCNPPPPPCPSGPAPENWRKSFGKPPLATKGCLPSLRLRRRLMRCMWRGCSGVGSIFGSGKANTT